jgi:hypothetical protein
MLGGAEHVAKQFRAALAKFDVELTARDCLSVEDVLDGLAENERIQAAFIIERACQTAIGGREEVLKKLRANDDTLRIIFCAASKKKEQEFENFCYCQRVSDILYPDDKGVFSTSELAKCVKKGRLAPSEDAPTGVEMSGKSRGLLGGLLPSQGKPKEKIVVKKVEKIVEVEKPVEVVRTVEVEKIVERPVEVVKTVEVEKVVYRDAPSSQPSAETSPAFGGAVVVGVFNVCRGAGSTSLCVEMAKEAAKRGQRVFIIAADGSEDLQASKLRHKNICISCDPDIEAAMMSAMCNGVQLILFDFGLLLPGTGQEQKILQRAAGCNMRIGLGFGTDWHTPKLEYYVGTFLLPTLFLLDKKVSLPSRLNGLDVFTRDELPPELLVDKIIGGTVKQKKGFFANRQS